MSTIKHEEEEFEFKKWNIASELGMGASKELRDPALAPAHTLPVPNIRMSGCIVCKEEDMCSQFK